MSKSSKTLFSWTLLFFLLLGGCATYGVLDREQTAATLGVQKEELKTPDTVRGR